MTVFLFLEIGVTHQIKIQILIFQIQENTILR